MTSVIWNEWDRRSPVFRIKREIVSCRLDRSLNCVVHSQDTSDPALQRHQSPEVWVLGRTTRSSAPVIVSPFGRTTWYLLPSPTFTVMTSLTPWWRSYHSPLRQRMSTSRSRSATKNPIWRVLGWPFMFQKLFTNSEIVLETSRKSCFEQNIRNSKNCLHFCIF